MLEYVISKILCFLGAVFFGLAPIALGFALGWIMRGEKNDK